MSTLARYAGLAAVPATVAAFAVVGANPASADTVSTFGLGPGQTACVQQYASYQARVDGTGTAGGASSRC